VVRESELKYIIDVISQLKNEDICDNVIVSSVEESIRISSYERGDLSID
jgi:nitrogen regulatory protein PII